MIANNIRSIIEKLAEKTKNNQATWNASSGSNGFRLHLKTGVINIDKWNEAQNDNWYIDFKIFNDRGDIIESILVSLYDDKPDFDYLDLFYSIIRRKYLKVDETLKGLLDELNENNPIGKSESQGEIIDDLPF